MLFPVFYGGHCLPAVQVRPVFRSAGRSGAPGVQVCRLFRCARRSGLPAVQVRPVFRSAGRPGLVLCSETARRSGIVIGLFFEDGIHKRIDFFEESFGLFF